MFLCAQRWAPEPADVPGLDQVARLLVSAGGPWHGLGVVARALAAWWRVGYALVLHDRPAAAAVPGHDPQPPVPG
ncbi:MAG: hypothetical protein ACRDT2_11680 [Natronosporangium sp.]